MLNKKLIGIVAIVLMIAMVYAPITHNVNADFPVSNKYANATIGSANRLVALQSSTDAGWDWVVTGLTAHTGSASSSNLYGVTGLDLIEAYVKTGNTAYYTAAKAVADHLAQGDPTTGAFIANGFGYSFDYEFLMDFAAASGISSYSTYAEAAWTWQKANYGSGRYMDGNQGTLLWPHFNLYSEPGYPAWSTADWGLAALQMGDISWANHMADTIHSYIGGLTTETITGNSGNNNPVLGMGEVLKFFEALPYAHTLYASDITAIISRLNALQNSDGSWSAGDPALKDAQATAYAVMGLVAAGALTSAQNGANWLVSTQLANGGWLETDSNEYSEVDSEANSAIVPFAGPYQPVLWVGGSTTLTGPCLKSTTFTMTVNLFNDNSSSDVYAWDFTMNWTISPYITLQSVTFSSPWANGSYYVIDNSFTNTSTSAGIHDAMTAVGTGTGLAMVNNFTLVTLVFHVNQDVLYAESPVVISFTLNNVSMSGDGKVPTVLDPEVDNDAVMLQSASEPEIAITTPGMLYDNATTDPTSNIAGDYYVTANANGVTHTFTVYVTNATDVFGFYVDLTWNSGYKTSDVQQITIDPNFPPPYEYISTVVGSGYAKVTVIRPCEKAPVCGASVNLFSIVLTEKVATGGLPTPMNTTVSITSAFILSKDPITGQVYQYDYPYPGTTFTADPAISVWSIQPLSYLGNMGNVWAPKSADLTYDGKVDINDLAVLAKVYGTASPYTGLTNVGFTNTVNIYDFVYVAKHFGDP